ncbi:hypothetical protein Poli38472_010135 [Pythium oligandrum]|uniref:Uncharacterized protein n=1 Tax=Pythium oligandrum TaxID=41045 RepID=A0A8K1FDP0_PYTOL|nr:hypothetical protein Poli38472_010135 [Pythium oligandrum]|eukprot:TMW58576.1 hypothetical protein Poli38472_010135 [Pythium oligandrum]
MADLGILEPQKSHGAVYPLMDWAAKEGHLNLLKLLHAHPFATKTCSDATFRWAVVRGDVAMAQWLHDNRTEHMRKRDAMLENAAEKGQIAMMEWLRANQMIPTLVV